MEDHHFHQLMEESVRTQTMVQEIEKKLLKGDKRFDVLSDRTTSLEHSRTRASTGMTIVWTILGGFVVSLFTGIGGLFHVR